MGKGEITGGGTDGLYTIMIREDRVRVNDRISKLSQDIAELDVKISTLNEELVALQIAYDAAKAADPPTPFPELAAMAMAINSKKVAYDLALVQRLSKSFAKKQLEAIPPDPLVSAWCADLSTSLAGTVGTIEPNGEPSHFIIRPGYNGSAAYSAPRDGQIQNVMANTPEGTFFNKAMMPGWQKWKPQYRIGTISEVDHQVHTCSVTLDDAYSRERPRSALLGINQGDYLSGVPIEYMSCNSAAFKTGDRVVVEFQGRDVSQPKVIGFESNPRSCGWENWSGPTIQSVHPWSEVVSPVDKGSIALGDGNIVLVGVMTDQELATGSAYGWTYVDWLRTDEAAQAFPRYPAGLILKIKLSVIADVPVTDWTMRAETYIVIQSSTGNVKIYFYNNIPCYPSVGTICADDNGGLEQTFDLSSYISSPTDINRIYVGSFLQYIGAGEVFRAAVESTIDYINFV